MKQPFDSEKYYLLQKQAIEDRVRKFSGGRLYLEIGGKFLYDKHAANVLPGFDPYAKVKILRDFSKSMDLLFCINATDIENNRLLKSDSTDYTAETLSLIEKYKQVLNVKPIIVMNRLSRENIGERTQDFINFLRKRGFEVVKRYLITDYPENVDTIASKDGFGFDQYAKVSKSLVIVSGPASNSGKLSTCLGQLYHESTKGVSSGYAKYELFPIWNLPVDHPVNIAYEAATADIGDYNVEDKLYFEKKGEKAVNYNRDVDAFKLLKKIVDTFTKPQNFMRSYSSPTEMGINMAGFCINDDAKVREAAIKTIIIRREIYKNQYLAGGGKKEWIERCDELIRKVHS